MPTPRWSGTSAPRTPGSQNLAEDPANASTTSVCLKFTDPRITDGEAFAKAVAKRLEKAGVAL
jgi:phosphoserine aminotransferase